MVRSSGSGTGPLDSRAPYGSSAILSIVVVGIVMAILVLGSLFILRRLDSDDGESTGAIPTPAGTSELVVGVPTATVAPTEAETPPPTATVDSRSDPTPTATAPDRDSDPYAH